MINKNLIEFDDAEKFFLIMCLQENYFFRWKSPEFKRMSFVLMRKLQNKSFSKRCEYGWLKKAVQKKLLSLNVSLNENGEK